MKCVDCKSTNTRVTSTDHINDTTTWRYNRCLDCGARFKTQETYAPRLTTGPKQNNKPSFKAHDQVCGEHVHTAVLTETNVKHLRQLAETGYTRLVLAKRFGINPSTVDRIIKRKTWKHI